MLFAALSSPWLPAFLPLGALAVVAVIVTVRFPVIAAYLLVGSVITGQLLRLPLLGQSGGLLPSDIAVVLVILAACASKRHSRESGNPVTLYTAPWLLFLVLGLWLLVIHLPDLGNMAFIISFAYWVRLAAILLLFPALISLSRQPFFLKHLNQAFAIGTFLFTLLGLVQLSFLPKLAQIGGGWDPHEYRLVSTWLDPNFAGAFLVLGLLSLLPRLLEHRSFPLLYKERARERYVITVLLIAALLLTRSRGTFVALAATFIILAPFVVYKIMRRPSRAAIVSFVCVLVIALTGAGVAALILGERALGLFQFDATVRLRADAFAAVWRFAQPYSLMGAGFNAYQFAAQSSGLISDFSLHSRAGADSSLLTLWVTTGLPGAALFLTPWLLLFIRFLRRFLSLGGVPSLSAAAAILFLFIHSQFVNSFLYPHLLIALIIVCCVASVLDAPVKPEHDKRYKLI